MKNIFLCLTKANVLQKTWGGDSPNQTDDTLTRQNRIGVMSGASRRQAEGNASLIIPSKLLQIWKYAACLLLAFFVGIGNAWADVIFESDLKEDVTNATYTKSSSSSFVTSGLPSYASPYENAWTNGSSTNLITYTFSPAIDLSDYTDVTIKVYYGSGSNRPCKLGINTTTTTQIGTTSGNTGQLLNSSADVSATSITSLTFQSASGSSMYFFHFTIEGTSSSVCTPPTIDWDDEPEDAEVGADDFTASVTTTPTPYEVTWTSSNTEVASVTSGVIKYKSAGSAKITASLTYSGDDFCEQTVKVEKTITVTPPQTYHSIVANIASSNYESYTIFQLFSDKSTVNDTYDAWVDGSLNSAGGTWTTPSGVTRFVNDGEKDWKINNANSIEFYVTNCVSVAILGKSGSTGRKIQLSVKENGVEVGSVEESNTNSVHVISYGTALNASKKYKVTITNNSSDNSYIQAISFEAPAGNTLQYNKNGGSGTTMENTTGTGTVTLRTNTYTKDGCSFAGWAISQDKANAGTVAYADGATNYSLSADATLYAVWKLNAPEISCENNVITMTEPAGATVYYTTDGSTTPTSSSPAYSSSSKPVIAANTTYKAIAIKENHKSSEVTTYNATYTNPTYTITGATPSNGTIAITDGSDAITSAVENADVYITATPNTGYAFSAWSIYKTSDAETTITPAAATASTSFKMPAYGVTVDATFTAVDYAITKTAAENGSYTVKVGSSEVSTANYGQTVTLTATPNTGYVLSAWNVTKTSGGTSVAMATENTFVMPAEAVTISPTFVQKYTVTFNSNGGTAVDPQYVSSGAKASVPTAPTRSNWTFSKWQLSGADYDFDATVTADITLDAVWSRDEISGDTYDVTLSSGTDLVGTYSGGGVSIDLNAAIGRGEKNTSNGGIKFNYSISSSTAGTNYIEFTIPSGYSANVKTLTLNGSNEVMIVDAISGGNKIYSSTGTPNGTFTSGNTYYMCREGSSEVVLSSVLTLIAPPISVTFKDGEETKYSKEAAKNETLGNLFDNGELPSLADKTGYTFGGWAISGVAVTKATEVTASVTVDAVWTAKTTAITLDKNDEDATADGAATATYGSSTLTDYVAATRSDGKSLIGYYDATTGGNKIIDETGALVAAWSNEAANVTLYAHWASNVDVTFYNGESEYAVIPVANGTVAVAPATDPSKSGYRFMGWAATSGGYVVDLSDYTITVERAFYAVFAQEYTVSFDANPSTAVIANQVVINGEKVLAPSDPTLAKWDFVEWQVAGAAYDFDNTTYTDNIELVATWARKAVSGVETDEIVVGASPSLNVVTAEYGYNQSYENGDYTLTGGMTGGTSGKRYVGVTIPENYSGKISITIASTNTRTGVVVDEDHKTNYSATENNLLAVAATSGGATGQSSTLSAGTYYVTSVGGGATLKNISVHLYAPEITVVFKDGETTKYSFTAAKNETLADLFIDGNLPTLSKEGYDFVGWYTATEEGSAVSSATEITASVTYYARWSGKTYDVVLVSNNENDNGSAHVIMGAEALSDITAPVAVGSNVLKGYYTAASEGTKVADASGNFENATIAGYITNGKWDNAANATLYAQWAAPVDVKFYPGYGANVQIGETQSVASGNYAVAPTNPEREGYRFLGWSTDGTEANIQTVASYAITVATDFTAVWKQEFKVEFDLQGGTGDIEDQYVLISEYPVAVVDPTRDQAEFLGWSQTASGDVVDITTVAITEDKKFYARWNLTLALNQVVFSNGFDAFIDASANTVKAYYMEGQSAPTVASYAGVNLKNEGGVTIINEGATLRIIGTDDTYKDFALTLEAVTPMSSFDKQTFDGLENYVKAGNSFHGTEKWYVSKNANDGRIPLGKTRMYFFVGGGADKATFTATVQERNIRVYVNNELVSSVTKTAAAGSTFDIPLNASAANNMIAIVSNQTSGDGGVSDIKLNEHAVSTSVALSSLTVNGNEVALQDGVYDYKYVLPYGTVDNPVVAAVAKDAPYETISEITQATSTSGTATFTVTPESGAPQVYTVKFSVSRARSLVIYNGNSLESSGSLEPGLQWTTTGGSTSESSASAQTFEGKSYTKYVNIFGSATKAPDDGNTRYMTITIPENYLAKFRLVGCGNGSGDRSLFISKEITGTLDESIAFVHTTSATITGMTSDYQYPGTYYLCCDASIRIYELSVTLYPIDYSREVTQNIYGTICLPNGGIMVGATIFEVAHMTYENNQPYKVFFDEVIDGVMEAGMPYIFLPKDDVTSIAVTYTDEANAAAGNHNGLHGTLSLMNGVDLLGKYIFYNNSLFASENPANWLNANRAYIKLSEVPDYVTPVAQGRRRVAMGFNGTNTATGFDQVTSGQVLSTKLLIDGKMYILRGEKMFDATGRLVK